MKRKEKKNLYRIMLKTTKILDQKIRRKRNHVKKCYQIQNLLFKIFNIFFNVFSLLDISCHGAV